MRQGILVCGCNGSGKSTLGKALANRLGWTYIDIEECFFPTSSTDYPYENPLPREQAIGLLWKRLQTCGDFVFSAVKGDYGHRIVSQYTGVVWLRADPATRAQRVKQRSLDKFGDRVLPGGDLYEREQSFVSFTAQRDETEVEQWLATLSCPVLSLDGTKPIQENVEKLVQRFSKP